MRALPLLAGLALAAALLNLAPVVDANADLDCVSVQYGGIVDSTVCADPCAYRSDCCASYSFWCPEDS